MGADYRSVSQVKDYDKCPHAYYLARVRRAWQRPAAWLPQGTAVHEAAEAFEKSGRTMSTEDAQDVFRAAYAREVNRYAADTPNLEYWYSSGPYRGEEHTGENGKFYPSDLERRYGIGLEQIARYVDYYTQEAPEEVIWITPDGTPAIELAFNIDLDGVAVRGFIDQVICREGREDGPDVRDIKTGNEPGDTFQLKVYALAIEDAYGVTVDQGDYWMGPSKTKRRKGGPTKPYDLTEMTREQVTEKFHEVDEGIRAEKFDPKPDADKCNFCNVRTSCSFSAV